MREIKFRAWCTLDNTMIEPMTLQEMIYSKKSNATLNDLNEYFIFEQFTGLYDKNGKEIYEGDIVNCWGGELVFGVWEYLEIIEILDIREMYELTNVNWEGIEVIGNIHDNKEENYETK